MILKPTNLNIRASQAEKAMLEQVAQAHETTPSEMMRQLIRQAHAKLQENPMFGKNKAAGQAVDRIIAEAGMDQRHVYEVFSRVGYNVADIYNAMPGGRDPLADESLMKEAAKWLKARVEAIEKKWPPNPPPRTIPAHNHAH